MYINPMASPAVSFRIHVDATLDRPYHPAIHPELEAERFYNMLARFMECANISYRAAGRLFGVSLPTIVRWLNREGVGGPRARWATPRVVYAHIEHLNKIDAQHALYARMQGLKASERFHLLRDTLSGRTAW